MPRDVTTSDLRELARISGVEIRDDELEELRAISRGMLGALDGLKDSHSQITPPPDALRPAGWKASRAEDPYNAIVLWCSINEGDEGILVGRRVGLKDTIAIRGVPMTCGSYALRGHVPRSDSVLTERVLHAGAEIVATLNMDAFALSGGGDTSSYGPTLNPVDPQRTAGGSSGGAAAALYYDNVDITYGTDQGGSIRIPASWCGVIGLKPTFGLVPYDGIVGLDQAIDHVGPLARSVSDLAAGLQAVAGKDGSVPREGPVPGDDYVSVVSRAADDLRGVKFGLLKEGLGLTAGVETQTADAVYQFIEKVRALRADVREVSVPEHAGSGAATYVAILAGALNFGRSSWEQGGFAIEMAETLTRGLKEYASELPVHVKAALVMGAHLREHRCGWAYAKALQWRTVLRTAYDNALADVDFLIMPAATERAHLYEPDLSPSERATRGGSMFGNTSPFNLTGHPAISIPAAEASGLPVGVMLVGRRLSEARMLEIARTLEGRCGWYPAVPAA